VAWLRGKRGIGAVALGCRVKEKKTNVREVVKK
jgi:hypothetical protein